MPQPLSDRELLCDLLLSQQHMETLYNTLASAGKTPALVCDLLDLLREEHDLQSAVEAEMQKRGWLEEPSAEEKTAEEIRLRFAAAAKGL